MIPNGITNPTILDTFCKAERHINAHSRVAVSISGGSDSDIVMDIVEKVRMPDVDIKYVFVDTGVEYDATKRQLDYLEQRYGVQIERLKAYKPIPKCIKEYGVPFLSKYISERMESAQNKGFDWAKGRFEDTKEKYGNRVAKWWHNEGSFRSYRIDYYYQLKEFLEENPPSFKISAKCCDYSKKITVKKYYKANGIDLAVIGVRKSEGGVRASAYDSCYDNDGLLAHYRPVFWLTDADKQEYEKLFDIHHSDCYTKYGLKRTGCVGCPFSRNILQELDAIKEYEPKLYKACMNMFGQSYEYKRKYYEFRKRMKNPNQQTFNFEGETE